MVEWSDMPMSAIDPIARKLLLALQDPAALLKLSGPELTDVVGRARTAEVLGRLGARAIGAGIEPTLPTRLRQVLASAITTAQARHRMARFETDRLVRALGDLAAEMVLLKGAAYVAANLPAAAGRGFSDVDVMFPKSLLDDVERRLLAVGWHQEQTDAYDQHYFRAWMHELPPLRHGTRLTVVDLHHNILPPSGRLKPDSRKLLAAAIPIAVHPGLRILAPVDMVLHTTAHLFQNGELDHTLRELIDIDDLIRHFQTDTAFWSSLLHRTDELGLGRPAFYALEMARRLLCTPIPPDVRAHAERWGPIGPLRRVMTRSVETCLAASGRAMVEPQIRMMRKGLYMRSHWLRMSPLQLARHLTRKSWFRMRARFTG